MAERRSSRSPPRVSFEANPLYSRLPRDDEAYVMRSFTKHAAHCDYCSNAYEEFKAGGTLCSRGHRRAADVAQYVFNKRGQAYSVVDREGKQMVQIEIPPRAQAVKSLLRAIEGGLKIQKAGEQREPLKERPVEVHNHQHHRRERRQKPTPIYTGKTPVYIKGHGEGYYQKRPERYYQHPIYYSPVPVAIQGDHYR